MPRVTAFAHKRMILRPLPLINRPLSTFLQVVYV